MQKKGSSWGIIALWFVLFFPVAVVLTVKKMSGEKLSYIQNGKALRIIGYILLGFAALYLVLALTGNLKTEDGSSIVGGVIVAEAVFGGGGALCVFYGTAYIRRGKKYKRYISVINTSNDLIIDNIASQIPTTYDKAVRDIQSMLDDGFFMNARLDLGQRELIMPRRSANRGAAGPDRTCVSAPKQTFCVKCKNCGATNTVVSGERNECKYCGSPL